MTLRRTKTALPWGTSRRIGAESVLDMEQATIRKVAMLRNILKVGLFWIRSKESVAEYSSNVKKETPASYENLRWAGEYFDIP